MYYENKLRHFFFGLLCEPGLQNLFRWYGYTQFDHFMNIINVSIKILTKSNIYLLSGQVLAKNGPLYIMNECLQHSIASYFPLRNWWDGCCNRLNLLSLYTTFENRWKHRMTETQNIITSIIDLRIFCVWYFVMGICWIWIYELCMTCIPGTLCAPPPRHLNDVWKSGTSSNVRVTSALRPF